MANVNIIFLADKEDSLCPNSIIEIVDFVPCGHDACTATAYKKAKESIHRIRVGYELVNLKDAPPYLCVGFLSLPVEVLDETEDSKYLAVSTEDIKAAIKAKKRESTHIKFARNWNSDSPIPSKSS